MNITAILDVAIGLTLVYLGTSLFVTILTEYVTQAFHLRSDQLEKNLHTLLPKGGGYREGVKDDPVLRPFFQTNLLRVPFFETPRRPSYVDPKLLATLLVAQFHQYEASTGTEGDTDPKGDAQPSDETAPSQNTDLPLHRQMKALSRVGGGNAGATGDDRFIEATADWVEQSLTMMGEPFKRKTQFIGFAIGFAIAVMFNVDTVSIVSHLYRDKEAREALSASAAELVASVPDSTYLACMGLDSRTRAEDARCAPLIGMVDGVQVRSGVFGRLPMGWPVPEAAPPRADSVARTGPYAALADSLRAQLDSLSTEQDSMRVEALVAVVDSISIEEGSLESRIKRVLKEAHTMAEGEDSALLVQASEVLKSRSREESLGPPEQPRLITQILQRVSERPGATLSGWILTGLAVALGASFWFDLLGNLVNIRLGMRKPERPAAEATA